jgi:hypothetical protein
MPLKTLSVFRGKLAVSVTDILGDRLQAARSDRLTTFNAYQLSLQSLIFPVAVHWVFNLVAAATMALLGQPVVALAYLLATCVSDAVQNRQFKTWLATSQGLDLRIGFSRLACAAGFRGLMYLSGPAVVALLNPGAGSSYTSGCPPARFWPWPSPMGRSHAQCSGRWPPRP